MEDNDKTLDQRPEIYWMWIWVERLGGLEFSEKKKLS